jgi:AcrR family transcriptional regulator
MAKRHNSRSVILEAAESVVVERGASSLTLDAVAARAGVSKGGLLYNFPSKDALLEAMVARLCDHFEQAIAKAKESAGTGSSDALKAYVTTTLRTDPKQHRVAAALLAAVANDTKLLAPMREHNKRFMAELAASDFDFGQSLAIWLATEGLWLLELFQLLPIATAQRRRLGAELLRLADQRELTTDRDHGARRRSGSRELRSRKRRT